MYSKVNYSVVGLFVLLFGAGLVLFAFWLANYGLHKDFDLYQLRMKESVTGLSSDSSVKLHGVDVGKVSKIRISPENIEEIQIFLKIDKGIPIKEDMIATTQMFGITGLLSINIEGGTNEAKTLEPTEEYIPTIQTAPSFVSKLSDTLGGLGDRLTVLLSKDNLEKIAATLENLEVATQKAQALEDKAMATLDEANTTLEAFTQAATEFKQMQKDFAAIKKVSIPTIESLLQTSKDFQRVTLKVEKSIDRGDYNLKQIFEPLLVDIRILSGQLSDMSREFEANPSDVLFKSRKPTKGPGE
ncbi:MAG TPA: MlaD family protein [Sulfurovum sp.]|jgi:phospholipid/cholesterol/gamma-HCH transport system substrate-binding protein|nr:MAG: ABC transporter substrate-binding protein [Sulfurovum sp. 35-42-20]OYZ23423.1 MAG: ABC transporter substrate-binding protein [Sulfurovum sp. 16-42-52]OYZ48040.1 MAG: ABC transporter substrate-binding protein [Sulfurovum sp. 24-42-9]OZA42492.1 MAG: ABC transporter substrate-binding protein [Sulfurovum sp. 17-42-90]OZA61124.1 MAG: ABC transporter substrate-binding protein [Sulfurovum sp. 39-42-12]HQR73616.1 MlaD family protein [Sulfurovum sp.]